MGLAGFEREGRYRTVNSYNSFGGGGPERSGWLCLSFWTQWASQFLWSWVSSWQIELGILSSVPSLSRTLLNFSSIWTIWEKSGRFSGCEAQHCSIRSRTGAGQLVGITGLTFWKLEKHIHQKKIQKATLLQSHETKMSMYFWNFTIQRCYLKCLNILFL
jgi:hypothetical protein